MEFRYINILQNTPELTCWHFPRVRLVPGLIVLLLMIGLLHSRARAQTVLTLEECLKTARQNSLALRGIENDVRRSGLELTELNRSALPTLSVQGKALHAPNANASGYDPAITDGGQYSAQLLVQDQLYDGGARAVRSDQIALDVHRLSVEQQRAGRDLAYIVTVAFYDALEGQEALAMQEHRAEDLTKYRELSERLFRGGGVDYTDVLKTGVSAENAAVAVQKARENARLKKIVLAETMGNPSDTSFTLGGPLEEPGPVDVDSLMNAISIDSTHIIDLRLADVEIQRSLLDVDLARRERYPSVVLSGDVGFLSSGDNLRLPADQRLSAFGYSIGVTIENLLFNWGSTDLRVQQREAAVERARLGYEEKRRGILGEIERLRYQLASAAIQLRSLRKTVALAEDSYVLTKARYAGGGISALEVLAAEETLAEIRSVQLQTRADLHRLLAKVKLWNKQ
jgi:outer membrane protein TolC